MVKKVKLFLSALVMGVFLFSAGGSGEDTPPKPLKDDEYAVKYTFESLIKKNLRDPDCYEFISCTPSGESGNEKLFIIKYRAKNGFGGYNVCAALVSCDDKRMKLIANE